MSFNRKRRFGNDDYHQPYEKRFHLPPIVELAKTLCGDLNTLGESTKRYVEDVEFMTMPIETNFEVESSFRDAVLNTFYAITTEQPHKVLQIAGLVQAIHSKNQAIGKVIVEFFHQKAQELLEVAVSKEVEPSSSETGPWNKLKLILRFWASLAYIIDDDSILAVFTQFLQLAIDLQKQTAQKRSPLAEAIYYNTLTCVPYLYPFRSQGVNGIEQGVSSLLKLAEEFDIVKTDISITGPFVELSNEVPYAPKEIVTLILPALNTYLASNERHQLFPELEIMLQGLINPVEKINLPPLALPSLDALKGFAGLDTGIGSVDGMWRTPRLTFEVYVPVDGLQTTPSSDTYTGIILRDLITDVVEALEFNRKEVARQIITIDLFFNPSLFAPPGISIDKLKAIDDGSSTYKVEDVAVETVLSLIYKLPTASQPFVYFYTTLVEACANASQAIAPVMGRAIRFFYTNVYHLDFELRFRYLDWLSVQLSNFNFTWKWREWESDCKIFGSSIYHPRGTFVRNLIAKELRLATREKIESTLTEEFLKFLDVSLFSSDEVESYYNGLLPNIEHQLDSRFLFLNDNVPFKSTVEKLIEVIHKDSNEHEEVIEELKNELQDYDNPERLLVTVIFQVIVFVGNRSISHAGKYISSTAESLKKLTGAVDGSGDKQMEGEPLVTKEQIWAIDAVLYYWNSEPHNGYLVLEILESFGIVSCGAIVQHSLNDTREQNLGLVNISAIETILRALTRKVYSGSGSAELDSAFDTLVTIIVDVLSKIGSDNVIEIPNVNDEVTESVENIWKYHTALGFTRMLLRKFSDEYVAMGQSLNGAVKEKITHKSTSKIITTWIQELESL